MKFPKPWRLKQTSGTDCVVLDANGRKLFYIMGDEGDGDKAEPSVLFWGDAADSEMLLNEIEEALGRLV
jgi:hypothetical protein